MALYITGKTPCSICGATLEQPVVAFPHFVPEAHPLWRFSDTAMHTACYERRPERAAFDALYAEFERRRDEDRAESPHRKLVRGVPQTMRG
jgi:hypothetical protein